MVCYVRSPRDEAILGIMVWFDSQTIEGCSNALLSPGGGVSLLEMVKQWQICGWRLPEGMEGEWYLVVEPCNGEVVNWLLGAANPEEAGCHYVLRLPRGGCVFLREARRFSRDRVRWMRGHYQEWARVFGVGCASDLLQGGMTEADKVFELWETEEVRL